MPTKRENQSKEKAPKGAAQSAASSAIPDHEPPEKMTIGGLYMGETRPSELPPKAGMVAGSGSLSAPTDMPPAHLAAGGGIKVWNSDKRVQGLWSINQDRNAWVYLSDVGWKKLANNSESSIVAMNILAGNARQMQSRIDTREEADGMIYEIYVW